MIPISPRPSSPSVPSTAGAELNEQLRRRALELFESQGFDATTAEDIARAGGISRRTFFRYFPVREDVLFSDHALTLLAVEQRLREGRGEPIRVAGAALEPLVAGCLADPDFTVRRGRLVQAHPLLRDREVLWQREYQQLLGDYLDGRDLGGRSSIYAQIVAAALQAAVAQVITRWLESPATEDPRALLAELIDEIAESMGQTGTRGAAPGSAHPERRGVVVIDSTLDAQQIARLIEGAEQ